jgi:hypothetical protein
VVRTYLGRAPVAAVLAAAAWVVVDPRRTTGHRDLVPVPASPMPAGFRTRELVLRAFLFRYIQAPAPMPLALPGAVAFPAR